LVGWPGHPLQIVSDIDRSLIEIVGIDSFSSFFFHYFFPTFPYLSIHMDDKEAAKAEEE
jgi:hypothetical protein